MKGWGHLALVFSSILPQLIIVISKNPISLKSELNDLNLTVVTVLNATITLNRNFVASTKRIIFSYTYFESCPITEIKHTGRRKETIVLQVSNIR